MRVRVSQSARDFFIVKCKILHLNNKNWSDLFILLLIINRKFCCPVSQPSCPHNSRSADQIFKLRKPLAHFTPRKTSEGKWWLPLTRPNVVILWSFCDVIDLWSFSLPTGIKCTAFSPILIARWTLSVLILSASVNSVTGLTDADISGCNSEVKSPLRVRHAQKGCYRN